MNALFINVLQMSLLAGYVIAVILVLRFPLRKAPKLFSYCLWAAAFFRLACPISPQSALSLFNLLPASLYQSTGNGFSLLSQGGAGAAIPSEDALQAPLRAYAPGEPLLRACSLVWFAVMLVLLLRASLSFLRLRKRLASSVQLSDGVRQYAGTGTPFALGIIKPVIYLPEGLTARQADYIICHESVHIKRHDPLIKLAAWLLLSVHWFNPLVWLAWRLMNRDMEMSCDEAVLKIMGMECRKEYSCTLLSLASENNFSCGIPAFCENGTGNRIKNILNYKKPGRWAIAALSLALIAACAALLFNPVQKKAPVTARQNCMTLKLRAEPSFEGEVVGLTAQDTEFIILDELKDGWCRIAVSEQNVQADYDAEEAYVRIEYLDITENADIP